MLWIVRTEATSSNQRSRQLLQAPSIDGESGVPVVRLEDLGAPTHPPHRLDRGPDEDREPPEPVVAPRGVRRVDPGPVEERVVRHEEDGDRASRKRSAEKADRVGAAEDGDLERGDRLLGPFESPAIPVRGLEVEREEDVHVVPAGRLGLRERADDVAEASRLREWNALGREVRDPHASPCAPGADSQRTAA